MNNIPILLFMLIVYSLISMVAYLFRSTIPIAITERLNCIPWIIVFSKKIVKIHKLLGTLKPFKLLIKHLIWIVTYQHYRPYAHNAPTLQCIGGPNKIQFALRNIVFSRIWKLSGLNKPCRYINITFCSTKHEYWKKNTIIKKSIRQTIRVLVNAHIIWILDNMKTRHKEITVDVLIFEI